MILTNQFLKKGSFMNEVSEEPLEQEKKKTVGSRFGVFWGYLILIAFTAIFLIFLYKSVVWIYDTISPYQGHSYKTLIHSDLEKATKNGADLDVIRTIFSNRRIDTTLWSRWFPDEAEVYIEPVSLGVVLSNVKSQYFLSANKEEKYLIVINTLIKENEEINPFDKLQPHQKDYFLNIRLKLANNYQIIENDINKVIEELYKGNKLVDEYLSDATMSLMISISGLVFALIIGIIQIWQTVRRNKLADKNYDEPEQADPQ